MAVATGPNGATGTASSTGRGVTTLNDYLWVPTGATLTLPTIAMVTPTGAGSLTPVAGGKTVKGITWRSDHGGQGIGLGPMAWSIDGIDLQSGDNVITVKARDSSSITTNSSITVRATTGAGPLVIAPSRAASQSPFIAEGFPLIAAR